MKISSLLFLLFNFFPNLPAQPPISPDEARRLLSAYLEYAEANPGSALTECFEPAMRKRIERGEVEMRELLVKAQILSVDPPEALVLASADNKGYWDRLLRFRFMKKGERIYLQPMVLRTWMAEFATGYHDETEVHRAFSEAERRQWRESWRSYLERWYGKNERLPDSLLWGDWVVAHSMTSADHLEPPFAVEGETLRIEPGGTLLRPGRWSGRGDWVFTGPAMALRNGGESAVRFFRISRLENGNIWCTDNQLDGFLLSRPRAQTDTAARLIPPKGFRVLCQPAYDEIAWFSYGFSCVRRGETYGFLDSRGREAIPCEYTFVRPPFNDIGQTLVGRDGNVWLIDTGGQVLRAYEYEKVYQLWNNLLMVEKAGKKGLVDTSGKVVLPAVYDDIDAGGWDYFRVLKDTRWGLYDYGGKEVLPPEFEDIRVLENPLAAVKSGGSYGVMDIYTSNWVIPCAYDKITLHDVPLIQAVRDGKTTLFRLDGTLLSKRIYEQTRGIGRDYMAFQRKGRRGVLNAAGAVVIPPVYDNVDYPHSQEPGRFRVNLKGVTVVRDSAGAVYPDTSHTFDEEPEEALFPSTAEPNEFGDWYQSFPHDGRYGYQLPDGRWMIPPLYDKAGKFVDGLAAVAFKGRSGLIDARGREVLPFLYDEVEIDEDAGMIFVKYKGKWGVLAREN
jgi:hypothetical protein